MTQRLFLRRYRDSRAGSSMTEPPPACFRYQSLPNDLAYPVFKTCRKAAQPMITAMMAAATRRLIKSRRVWGCIRAGEAVVSSSRVTPTAVPLPAPPRKLRISASPQQSQLLLPPRRSAEASRLRCTGSPASARRHPLGSHSSAKANSDATALYRHFCVPRRTGVLYRARDRAEIGRREGCGGPARASGVRLPEYSGKGTPDTRGGCEQHGNAGKARPTSTYALRRPWLDKAQR